MSKIKMPWRADDEDPVYVEDSNGIHIASFQSEEAARRAIACVNACDGIDTELLEETKCWAEAGIESATILRNQSNNLLAALERLSSAALSRDSTIGDQCRLIEVRAELAAANKQAMEAIAIAKGGA